MGGRGRFLRRRRRRGDDKKNSGEGKGKWRKGKIEVGIRRPSLPTATQAVASAIFFVALLRFCSANQV